jgi:hypothetical protein
MIDLAYVDTTHPEADDPALVTRYFDATIAWNSAVYAVLLVSPPGSAERIVGLDREVDRLLDLALARECAIAAFRAVLDSDRRRGGLGDPCRGCARTPAELGAPPSPRIGRQLREALH